MINKTDQIKNLTRCISQCTLCSLSKTRTNVVVGTGVIPSRIFFIGEAPGSAEDKQGKPFVGRAGKLFDSLLSSIDIQRKDVYIANILKCRPPKNRNPKSIEISQCTPYLEKQLELVNPEIIAPLGNFATKYCCNKYDIEFDNISNIHGEKYSIKNKSKSCILIPLFHPAAAVYNPNLTNLMLQDMEQIKLYK
jgi:DNA polymerase